MISSKDTIQQGLEQLSSNYSSLFNEIGVMGSSQDMDLHFKPNLFHTYSTCNIDEKVNNLQRILEAMKLTFHQYGQWQNDPLYLKLINNQKFIVITSNKVKQISKAISDCSLFGKMYLDALSNYQQQVCNTTPNHISHAKKLSLLASKLHDFITELDLKYGTSSDLEELISIQKLDPSTLKPDTVYRCSISSATFLLDIFINGDGTINDVTLMYSSTTASQDVTDDLIKSLKTKDKEFESKVRRLCNLDLLFRKYKTFDLHKVVTILQQDFQSISNVIAEKYQDAATMDMFSTTYGKITHDYCGVKFVYYQTIQQKMMEECGYVACLELEEGMNLVKLPLISLFDVDNVMDGSYLKNTQLLLKDQQQSDQQPQPLPTDDTIMAELNPPNPATGSEPQSITPNYLLSPIRLVLKLEPCIHVTYDVLCQILGILKREKDVVDYSNLLNGDIAKNQLLYIENQIIGSKDRDKSIHHQPFDNQILGVQQRYFYTNERLNVGYEISRLPITYPNQILPIFQILRQQIVFNMLFKSCFTIQPQLQNDLSSPSNTPPVQVSSSSSSTPNIQPPIFEVQCEPPHSIYITFLHPTLNQFRSITINIGKGGIIDATIDDNSICSNQYLTSMLTTSKSIPLTFYYLFNRNQGQEHQ